ncbi:MAG: DUF2520 domain-containing protein [Actinomycetaceae bacterium]|nr:DUF2520 domain-containing protein [Actinomycetaceae bacterium]
MKPARFRVGIIGAGRVGPILGRALQLVDHDVIGITRSRSEQRNDMAEAILGVPFIDAEQACDADLVLIAVPDDQIKPLVDGLAKLGRFRPGQIVMHTSGAHGIGVLSSAQAAGALPIALHPAMTFTGYSVDLQRLESCPAAITSTPIAEPIATALAYEMGMEPTLVAEENRVLYHAGLAHGANHLVTLVSQATQILTQAGIENPSSYIRPLLTAALERALSEGPAGLTGPVRRADTGTLQGHQKALKQAGLDAVANTYTDLAHATAEMANEQRILTDAQLRDVLSALLIE